MEIVIGLAFVIFIVGYTLYLVVKILSLPIKYHMSMRKLKKRYKNIGEIISDE